MCNIEFEFLVLSTYVIHLKITCINDVVNDCSLHLFLFVVTGTHIPVVKVNESFSNNLVCLK